ncbi:hypothetical protein G6F40_017930 [Rhizopus arrhizus]|nr:hypothetical protein G6F40_017930 [Rhizopus arrhizus]
MRPHLEARHAGLAGNAQRASRRSLTPIRAHGAECPARPDPTGSGRVFHGVTRAAYRTADGERPPASGASVPAAVHAARHRPAPVR